jgi:hypothetical protein
MIWRRVKLKHLVFCLLYKLNTRGSQSQAYILVFVLCHFVLACGALALFWSERNIKPIREKPSQVKLGLPPPPFITEQISEESGKNQDAALSDAPGACALCAPPM